jgi:hypothetical protein
MFVKNFDNFRSDSKVNEEFNFFDFLGKTWDIAGDALSSTVKQKVVAVLMEKFGILENSLASEFLQQVVSAIPVGDWPEILMGDKGDAKYFAPKMAEAIQFTVQKKGLDDIFKTFGFDSNGLIARTVLNAIMQNESKEKIENFILSLFGEEANIGKEAMSALDQKERELLNNSMFKAAKEIPNFNLKSGFGGKDSENQAAGILSGLFA